MNVVDSTKKPVYTSIYHDKREDMIFCYFADGTITTHKAPHVFYTPNAGEYGSMPSGKTDIFGRDMYIGFAKSAKEEQDIRNKHRGKFNHIAEIDIDSRTRFLEMYYTGVDELRFKIDDFNICYLDIEVAAKKGKFPKAEDADYPVNCVTIYLTKQNKFYTFGLNRDILPETIAGINKRFADEDLKPDDAKSKLKYLSSATFEYIKCPTEVNLIETLFKVIGESNCDFLSGYNSDGYDFPYLWNRSNKIGADLKHGSRLKGKFKRVEWDDRNRSLVVNGTEVIDYLKLYKKFSRSEKDNYRLDTIGKQETGEAKAPLPDGYQSYINYWDDFVLYNVMDVELLLRIEAKKRLFETTIGACTEARVPYSAIFEAKKMLVGFILNYLHKNNLTFPPLKDNEREDFPGAYVYSTPGYYDNLVSYDYRSMYPSIMMGANISPETKVEYPFGYDVPEHELVNLVRSPWTRHGTKQVFYRKDKVGVIPSVVRILFDGRTDLKNLMKKAKRDGRLDDVEYYDIKQNSYKLFGNSLYGLLGNPYFQFYDVDNSASVTAFGKDLILSTIDRLTYYFENDFKTDERFKNAFGSYPELNKDFIGEYINKDGEVCKNRLSHGDTDSFFVKYDDIYQCYKPMSGKKLGVIVIKDKQIVSNVSFDIKDEKKAKIEFNNTCKSLITNWNDISGDDKYKLYIDGVVYQGDIRIIYNRYSLTDFCRVIDAVLMEDKLDEIMLEYANKWNYYENTLFLKREKCILQAIVTAKKKYICLVESNEDIVYINKKTKLREPDFAITGLEIVRSSTTPFSRERLLNLIGDILETKNKQFIRERMLTIKNEFFDHIKQSNYYAISIPSGVKKDPPHWVEYVQMTKEEKKDFDWRVKSASVWNYLIDTDEELSKFGLEPISGGSKVKFIKVKENKFDIKAIAYIGDNCPERILEIFQPDWEEQWVKTFGQTMNRLFDAMGWGKNFEHDESDFFMDIYS